MPSGTARCSTLSWKSELCTGLANPISNPMGSSLPWDHPVQARMRKTEEAMTPGWPRKGHWAVPLRLPSSLVTPLPPPKSAAVPWAEPGGFPVLPMDIFPNVGAAGSQLKSTSVCLGE